VIMLASGGSSDSSARKREAAKRPAPDTGAGQPEGGKGAVEDMASAGAAGPIGEVEAGRPVDSPGPGGAEPAPRPSPKLELARLKDKLAGGSRDEFPPGTEARSGSHFLLVDERMGWWDAKEFAEAHGAHVAILPEPADRRWFHEKFPSGEPVWIGGGRASNDRWQWLDGSPWTGGTNPVADAGRRHLAVGTKGALLAESASERFQVALQWRDDASNPASTGAQLKRTVESIKPRGVENAIYPVGTRSYSELGSHFFHVPKVVSWDEARKLAKAAGGYLAVPSSKAESDWLRSSFGGEVPSGMKLWLGGFRLEAGEPWRWLTGEAWNHPKGWLGGSESIGNSPGRLMLQLGNDGAGWIANDGAEGAANGLLIEWSPAKKAAAIAAFDLESWLEKTDANFTALIQADIDKYEKAYGLAIDRYIRAIERLGRKHKSALAGQEGREKDRIREAIEDAVREVEKSGQPLAEVPKSAPDDFHDLQKKTQDSLAQLAAEFQKNLSRQLGAYRLGLTKQSGLLIQDGYTEDAAALKARVESIDGDSAAFLKLLALVDPTAVEAEEGDAPADA